MRLRCTLKPIKPDRHVRQMKNIQKNEPLPFYLDYAATTPINPEVLDVLIHYTKVDYGNEGSRTHEYGARAKQAVQQARDWVAELAGAKREEVVFTSGATEANNLAILGLESEGLKTGKKHIITTALEHKAVLEPMVRLEERGFTVDYIRPDSSGRISAIDVSRLLREDTLLISVMHANNETGVLQPIQEITELLQDHSAYFHVDAAQTFGKEEAVLHSERIDLISASAHKLYGPKGIGALITRKRGFKRPPLTPLLIGGGQERGLRPGTLPVPLICAFGKACELANREHGKRKEICLGIRKKAVEALLPLNVQFNGDQQHCLAHILNFSIPGIDSEAAIVALKGLAAFSNGSACTSASYTASHVLMAMGLPSEQIESAVRFSWGADSTDIAWVKIAETLMELI